MNFVVVLVTLSILHPCAPARVPHQCGDFVTRMDTYPSRAACEKSAAWWNRHIADSMAGNTLNGIVEGDTGAAVCVRKQEAMP